MKKSISILAGLLAAVMTVTTVGAAPSQKISDWAQDGFQAANAAGFIPQTQYLSDYTKPVQRGYVAELLMRAYNAYSGEVYKAKGTSPFRDGYSEYVKGVYELGIMNGTDEDTFGYDEYITREQMAKVLLTFRSVALEEKLVLPKEPEAEFIDFDSVSDWAKPYVAKAASDELISGYTDGRFAGEDMVSWEMAIVLIMRCADFDQKEVPEITSLEWDSVVPSNKGFDIEVSGKGKVNIYGVKAGDGDYSRLLGSCRDDDSVRITSGTLESDSLYYIFAEADGVFSKPVRVFTDKYNLILNCDMQAEAGECEISWARIPGVEKYVVTVTEQRDSYYEGDILPNTPDIYEVQWEDSITINLNPNRIYKIEISADTYYASQNIYVYAVWPEDAEEIMNSYPQTKEEAEALQVQVTVPVWKINKKGQKYASTASFKVHYMIADKIKLVFEEIFNGPEQFPIKDVGGYSWRGGRSEHNGGTAVDINANENYCLYSDGRIVGSHWKPYEDQYSITPYGDVINAFEKYGFTWGGDAWSSPKDYMHFSYLGT